jgi:hypothetical protein
MTSSATSIYRHAIIIFLVIAAGEAASMDAARALIGCTLIAEETSAQSESPSLPESILHLCVAEVYASWTEDDLVFDDQRSTYGSAVFLGESDGNVYLLTDLSVTLLEELSKSDNSGPPMVLDYEVNIYTPSSQFQPVRAIGVIEDLDLAVLMVSAENLVLGRDYVVAPPTDSFEVGDEVYGFGKPLDMPVTRMHGEIVALPGNTPTNQLELVATDIVPPDTTGFRGGPFFVGSESAFRCLGVMVIPEYFYGGLSLVRRMPLSNYLRLNYYNARSQADGSYPGIDSLLEAYFPENL